MAVLVERNEVFGTELNVAFREESDHLVGDSDWGAFLALLSRHIQKWNATLGVTEEQETFLEAGVLQNAFAAFPMLKNGKPEKAAQWLVHSWEAYVAQVEDVSRENWNPEGLLSFEMALYNHFTTDQKAGEGSSILRRFMTVLGLSQDEVGRMFGVSGETIRRWERGHIKVPDARMAQLVSAAAALDRLQSIFLPHRLAPAIRRNADLFEGERALDLILRGRIADVASRYEIALAYQA